MISQTLYFLISIPFFLIAFALQLMEAPQREIL